MSKLETLIEEMAKPITDEYDLELVDVEFKKEGGNWYLRVFIDKPDGITHEDCEQVSNRLSDALDKKDPIEQSYHLEVSSPGIERPLKKIEDFEKFKGTLVNISTFAAIDGHKTFQGKVEGTEDDNIVLMVNEKRLLIPYNKVSSAKLAFDF